MWQAIQGERRECGQADEMPAVHSHRTNTHTTGPHPARGARWGRCCGASSVTTTPALERSGATSSEWPDEPVNARYRSGAMPELSLRLSHSRGVARQETRMPNVQDKICRPVRAEHTRSSGRFSY